MADANDGRVTLWRYGEVYFDLREPPPDVEHHEYIARPRADDDAREERLKRAEEQRDALAQECSETEHVAREAGADESIMPFPVALHDLLTRLTDERDDATRDRDEWKARAERAEAECAAREDVQARLIKERNAAEAERDSARAVAQRLGRVLAELTNPYASPILYTQPPTPDEYDTDTVHSYAMGARAGQYLALCIVKSAVARIDAEAGGGK